MAAILRETLNNVMDEIDEMTELFARFLRSYPDRLKAMDITLIIKST